MWHSFTFSQTEKIWLTASLRSRCSNLTQSRAGESIDPTRILTFTYNCKKSLTYFACPFCCSFSYFLLFLGRITPSFNACYTFFCYIIHAMFKVQTTSFFIFWNLCECKTVFTTRHNDIQEVKNTLHKYALPCPVI